MPATKIMGSNARRTETPNAAMTTLASPTQGGTSVLSLWRVAMRAGQQGPDHTFDVEQAWHLLDGAATVAVRAAEGSPAGEDSKIITLAAGDTLVVPAGAHRQISTASGADFIVTGPAGGSATPFSSAGAGDPVLPGWIA